MACEQKTVTVCVKWMNQEFRVSLAENQTVWDLKKALSELTAVDPKKQKLIGLKLKSGKLACDNDLVSALDLKPNQKAIMIGTPEHQIAAMNAPKESKQEENEILNDFDVGEEFVLDVKDREENHKKIQNRINSYEPKILNPPRQSKKLLVLDIDYTIFDNGSTVDNVLLLKRPYLDEFLEAVYEFYDIMIWSANSMKWIEAKMTEIGVLNNPKYKITALFDKGAMITVSDPKYGVIDIKPLGVIWGKFPQHYNAKNTIMLDDLRRNFLMNPENGLKIRPFVRAPFTRDTDKELLYLKEYLLLIAKMDDLSKVKHNRWESYIHRS